MMRGQAVEFLRSQALKAGKQGAHDYLPKNEKDADTWQPHEWMVDALIESANKSQITLSIGELVNLCDFAGVAVDKEKSVFADDQDQYDTPITLHNNIQVDCGDGEVYVGIAATFSEYPEEGTSPLKFEFGQ